jgi:peptidoglycan/xylan/chitin deacetylase (PgdA/CDA1 family)
VLSKKKETGWTNGFHWPNGAHIAVVFNISWETWPKKLATAQNNQRAREVVDKTAKYGRSMMHIYPHAYAETSGMQRLLDVWERHDIKSSCYADGLTVELYPELARQAFDAGHEFLVQGWDHSFLWEQTIAEQTESIDKTIAAFEKVLGKKVAGFSAAGGTITPETFDIAAARDHFKYCCGFRNTDVPFIIPRKDRNLVGMNSYNISDFMSYDDASRDIRDVMIMWRDFFDVLYDEGQRGYPKMLAYGTHPMLATGYRTKPLEETIQYVQNRPNVWITTRGEIADWVIENFPEMDLSTFYPEAVASDKWYGLSLGIGGEEADTEARSYRVE